jgi:hypothetical protein
MKNLLCVCGHDCHCDSTNCDNCKCIDCSCKTPEQGTGKE